MLTIHVMSCINTLYSLQKVEMKAIEEERRTQKEAFVDAQVSRNLQVSQSGAECTNLLYCGRLC